MFNLNTEVIVRWGQQRISFLTTKCSVGFFQFIVIVGECLIFLIVFIKFNIIHRFYSTFSSFIFFLFACYCVLYTSSFVDNELPRVRLRKLFLLSEFTDVLSGENIIFHILKGRCVVRQGHLVNQEHEKKKKI